MHLTCNSSTPSSELIRLYKDQRAATALEFALLLPAYLCIIFAIFEICFVVLLNMMLDWSVDAATRYMEVSRQNYETVTEAGVRGSICGALRLLPVDCDESSLKIALVSQDDATSEEAEVPYPVVNRFDDPDGGIYILAVGYSWPFVLPSTWLALPFAGASAQVQSSSVTVLAERVTEVLRP